MARRIIIKGSEFEIVDAGGEGDCFFKCLATFLPIRSTKIRAQIVAFVVKNWEEYCEDVLQLFGISKSQAYKIYMDRPGRFASLIECRAAANLYNINIKVDRQLVDGQLFALSFEVANASQTVHLLFTGHLKENSRDGHFQILKPIININLDFEQIQNPAIHYKEKEIDSHEENINNAFFEGYANSHMEIENDDVENNFRINYTDQSLEDSAYPQYDSNEANSSDQESDSSIELCNTNASRRYHCVLAKQLIINAREYFEKEKEAGYVDNLDQVVQRTAKCLKRSERTVKRITGNWKKDGNLAIKPKTGRPSIPFDEFMQGLIRQKIYDCYAQKSYPTVKWIYKELREIPDLPEFKETTLKKWLKLMNFSYKKFNKKNIYMENTKIAAHRDEYLRKISNYRNNGFEIFYTDETWCGANHTRKYGWVEKITSRENNNFDYYRDRVQEIFGERGGFRTPSGAGKRVIILHIGSENGFVDGCMDCFIDKKETNDYHDAMNSEHYEEWFRHVLDVLPEKSVIVLDQAPYHTMLDPDFRNPTTQWRKENIVQWLIRRPVSLPEDVDSFYNLTKNELLVIARQYHYPKKYILERITRETRGDSVKLLWLPVSHCEFNPIELVWANVKNYVAKYNNTFKISDVHELCKNAMANISQSLWPNCIRHAIAEENKYRKVNSIVAAHIESIVINLNDSNSEDNDDDIYCEGAVDT